MTNESILISEVIPATPQRIFSAWMDSAEHSAFTGDEATVVPEVGGELRVGGGYIQGRTLELNEGSRIVHSWRTTEFPPDSPDSRVEITLEPTLGGTLVTLLHTDIPVGQGDRYRQGWNEYYLSRLKSYFSDAEGAAESPAAQVADGQGHGRGMSVDLDLDEETSVGGLEPTTAIEAPTRVMKTRVKRTMTAASRGATPSSTGDTATVRVVRSAAPARASQAKAKPVRAGARAAKVSSKKRAKAKARRPAKTAVKSAARRPAKKSAAKMSARRAAKKPARKPAKKPTMTPARRTGAQAKRPTSKKKASSSARSRR
ncbi:MAG TPA: SRPBCC domain-containing protein [Polyangia bacterium]|nr:SRPBCC domain-containing protein [Polyangia bacterium]